MRYLFKYFFTHSFFVAIIAVALVLLTFHMLHLPPDHSILGMAFLLVLSAYNIYWMLLMVKTDKKNRKSFILSRYAPRLTLIFISAIALFDYLWYRPGLLPALMIPFALTVLYCLVVLNNAGVFSQDRFFSFWLKTLLLSITWSFTTVVLPLHSLVGIFEEHHALIFLNRFLFIWMICVVFEMKDAIHRPDIQKRLFAWMMVLLLAHSISIFLMPEGYFFQMAAASVLAVLLFMLSWLGKRGFYFYYLGVDGLMLLYAFSLILVTI